MQDSHRSHLDLCHDVESNDNEREQWIKDDVHNLRGDTVEYD